MGGLEVEVGWLQFQGLVCQRNGLFGGKVVMIFVVIYVEGYLIFSNIQVLKYVVGVKLVQVF